MIVALRQEIIVANMTKRVVEPIADHCNVDMSLEPASDAMWTYRIIAHTARVTNFAYGNNAKNVLQWDRLWKYTIDWDRQKPDSFRPMYCMNGENTSSLVNESSQSDTSHFHNERSTFPRIYYTYDCPIAGQQYLQLCRVLLLAHDPRTPVLGLGRADFQRNREEDIRDAVRLICGITISNPEYSPAKGTAGLAIGLCGELFSDLRETVELLRIVSEAELHLGWPCLKVSHRLRVFWNLQDLNL